MTNNDICLFIYNNIDIRSLCYNMGINNFYNVDDLVQHIYEIILLYDLEKLKYLYNKKLLKPFIIRVILNNKYGEGSYLNKSLKLYDHIYYDTIVDDEPIDNGALNYIELELNCYENYTEFFQKKCLKLKYKNKKGVKGICLSLNLMLKTVR